MGDRIADFNGIIIWINGADHNPPHFHAYYAEYEILIRIKTLDVLRGRMPKKQLSLILSWAKGKENELLTIFTILNPNLRQ
jgi:hypothetical protein